MFDITKAFHPDKWANSIKMNRYFILVSRPHPAYSKKT